MHLPLNNRSSSAWVILVLLGITCLLYWPGLAGPYLFDDFWNLSPVEKWAEGQLGWRQAMFPNPDSVIDSRPLAMSSFMLTTWLGGLGPFPTKLGNLVLHLACGLLVWSLVRRVVLVDHRLVPHANVAAIAITSAWLLHPLHVSTVLYSVQRMSQWSTLAVLGALIVYLSARNSIARGEMAAAARKLFVLFPTLIIIGVLGKQNAIVAPALCLVVEAVMSRTPMSSRGRKLLLAFFLCALVAPLVAIAAYVSAYPGVILDGYQDWDFTLEQRLLTQPRVLFDYVAAIALPYSPGMGLYTDDFPLSTGLLHPASTLVAIVSLIGLTSAAFVVRKQHPLVFMGWTFFLVAHSIEAGPLPIEMHYEHRNYLPSVGLLLAFAGLVSPLLTRAPSGRSLTRILGIAAGALVFAFSVATFGRVLVWQSFDSIVLQGAAQNPLSIRAASDAAWLAVQQQRHDEARARMSGLLVIGNPRAMVFAHLQLAALNCYAESAFDASNLQRAVAHALPTTTVYEAQAIRGFDNATLFGQCREIPEVFAAAAQAVLDAAIAQPETSRNKYVPRETIARLYARGGDWKSAEHQAELSWQAGRNSPTGALLGHIYIRNGELRKAEKLIEELGGAIPETDLEGQRALAELRTRLRDKAQ